MKAISRVELMQSHQRLINVYIRFQLVNAQSFQNQEFCLIPGSCSILSLAKSILWSKYSKRWLVTSLFLHFLEPGLCSLSRVSKFVAFSPM